MCKQSLSEVTFGERLSLKSFWNRGKKCISNKLKLAKGHCTQNSTVGLLEMEMMNLNCYEEDGYTLEKAFNFWDLLALD